MSWIDLAQYGFINNNLTFFLIRAARIENIILTSRERDPDQLRIHVYTNNHEYVTDWLPQRVAQDHVRRLTHALGHREAISFATPAPMEEDSFEVFLEAIEPDSNYPVELSTAWTATTNGGSRS